MTDLEILMQARAMITDPKHWTRLHYHTRSFPLGRHRYCAIGALSIAAGEEPLSVRVTTKSRAWDIAMDIMRRQRLGRGLMGINDTPDGTGHKRILAIFDRAIEEELEAWIGSPSEQVAPRTTELVHA